MTNKELNIYIPNDLSLGIIQSQVVNKGEFFFSKKYSKIKYHCNQKNKTKLENLDTTNINWYRNVYLSLIKLPRNSHVYTRSIWEFIIVLVIGKVFRKSYIIYDYRGLVSSEFEFNNGSKLKLAIINFIEKLPAKYSDEIHTVSIHFKNILEQRFKTTVQYVVPCLVSSVNLPQETVIEDTIKLIYVGGMSKWQKIEEILVYFNTIQTKLDCSLTIITGDQEKLKPYLTKYKHLNIQTLSGNNDFVINELRKHHVGFLFRDDLMFNQVASPVKFLEYITNGVIPIMSNNIGDYSDLTKNLEIGFTDKEIISREEIINKRRKLFNIQNKLNIFSWKDFDEEQYLKMVNKKV
jgi:hypothetical protein